MKIFNILWLSLAFMLCSGISSATECRWLKDGTGGWSDTTRWQDGVKPTQAGDTVIVSDTGVNVKVEDADLETFAFVADMTIPSGSCVTFDTASDVHTTAAFRGEGQMIKLGANTLYLDNVGGSGGTAADCKAAIGNLTGGLVVSNGTVRAPDRTAAQLHLPRITIESGAEFRLGKSKNTAIQGGLRGSGTFTTDYPSIPTDMQLVVFSGGTASDPCVFSGSFSASVSAAIYGYVYFTGTDGVARTSCTLYSSVGLKKIGKWVDADSTQPSSVGHNDCFMFYYKDGVADPALRFLGTEAETTDKELRFPANCKIGIVDAGNYGGVTFTGPWRVSHWQYWTSDLSRRIVLEGENTVNPCVIACSMEDSDVASTYITKRGTGIWRFNTDNWRKNAGTLAVQRGTVQYESIAEQGVISSLGTSAFTCEDEELSASPTRVPYAFLLGDGVHTASDDYVATMEYIGDAGASCTSRVFAINGAGRIKSSGGPMKLGGVTAFGNGTSSLILDGALGHADVLTSVTNGAGKLNVVKRGKGSWNLGGAVDVNDIAVEDGTLKLGCDNFTFYRFCIRRTYVQTSYVYINGFALLDDEGNVINGTLGQEGVNFDKVGHPELLDPGEVTLGAAYWQTDGELTPSRMFLYDAETGVVGKTARLAESRTPDPANPNSWYYVYFRMPAGSAPVTAYDIKSSHAAGEEWPNKTELHSWQLDASVDGENWVTIDEWDENPNPAEAANRWFSNGSAELGVGFKVNSSECPTTATVKSLAVSAGATAEVKVDVDLTFDELTFNAAGCGTLKGGSIADTGKIYFEGSKSVSLPTFTFDGVENADAIENWKVWYNGRESRMKPVRTATGFTIVQDGLYLIFK